MTWVSVLDELPDAPGVYLTFVPTLDEDYPLYQTAWYEPPGSEERAGWQVCLWPKAITHWARLVPPEVKS